MATTPWERLALREAGPQIDAVVDRYQLDGLALILWAHWYFYSDGRTDAAMDRKLAAIWN